MLLELIILVQNRSIESEMVLIWCLVNNHHHCSSSMVCIWSMKVYYNLKGASNNKLYFFFQCITRYWIHCRLLCSTKLYPSPHNHFLLMIQIDQDYKEQQLEVLIHTLCNIWKHVLFLPRNSAHATQNYIPSYWRMHSIFFLNIHCND
jgi:hypothetical protein